MARKTNLPQAYRLARERYAALGVDTEKTLRALARVPLSLHCWQGDDVGGFEPAAAGLSGGLVATGNYPGKARTPAELRGGCRPGACPDSGPTSLQSPRLLRRIRRPKGRPQRSRAGAFPGLDRLGKVAGYRSGL